MTYTLLIHEKLETLLACLPDGAPIDVALNNAELHFGPIDLADVTIRSGLTLTDDESETEPDGALGWTAEWALNQFALLEDEHGRVWQYAVFPPDNRIGA